MDHRDRIEAATRRMKAEDLALLVAFSNGAHHVESPDAVALLSDVRPMGDCMVLLRPDGESTLVVSPAWDAARAARRSRTTATRGSDDIAASFAEAVAAAGLAGNEVGIAALSRMSRHVVDGVRAALGGDPTPADDLLFGVSALTLGIDTGGASAVPRPGGVGQRKTSEELARAERATAIAEAGHQRMLEIARPGMPEFELATEMKGYMASLGADDNFLMLAARPHNRAVMPSSGRVLEPGDIIIAEATPSFEGQFSQICRTAILGPAPAVLEEKYGLVVDAMQAGIAAARPGNPMSAVCAAIDAVLSAQGYAEYCHPPYIRRRGHGLGLTSVVPGNVALDNDIVLEEDMFFVIHPNQYLPETGYLMCGEPTVVAPGGGRPLSRRSAWLASIPV